MPATMPALQFRHEAPPRPRLVAEAPHLVVHTGGGYYPRLASTFPAPSFTPKLCVLSFTVHQCIFNTGYRRMTGFLRSRGLRIQQCRIREAMWRVNPAGVLYGHSSLGQYTDEGTKYMDYLRCGI